MMTNKEIYNLHTSHDSEPSELYEAYQDVPLDSLDESRKNNTPLHTACHFADMTAVGILLDRGADPNVKNDDGDTPLCVMARRGPRPDDADIAGLLLSKGARVPRSGKDTTALIEAVRNRNFQMADALLTTGNRIDSTDRSGRNVLHVICLSAGLIADDIRRTEGRIADFSQRWYSDKSKQEAYAELENLRESDRQCCHTAKLILESGQIDPEEKDSIGKTAFDIAVESGARKIGALLSGQDPETDGLAALAGGLDIFQALWHNDMTALDALLRSGVDTQSICEDKNMTDFKGKSPLGCALAWENFTAAEMLLRGGADPNFRDAEERTAFAVWMSNRGHEHEDKEECLHFLQCLTECGWDPESPADKEGNTALSVACRGAGYDTGIWAVRYLVENGADVNAANMQGQTPAMNLYGGRYWDGNIPRFAAMPRSYPYDGRSCTEQDAETLEILLEAGTDINARDKWGNTLLHYIAASSMRGSKEAAALVMDFGTPDVNAVNNEGLTALDIAAKKNDESLVKFLLKYS
ncbi:ankyrin repeat domain-containing protein [Bacteroides nordii]|uniref:ankyrin repeat domain-containing protein n=1 Tax=Bacteroides nordii TaxID=291645 RepID=UPI0022DF2164|nr:ankyrin repeat domain-containing protein [Bacteroides nordii]